MRKALDDTGTCGIGEIAFSGREHLVALAAPPDPKQKGLMLYQLRYQEELRDAKSVLGDIKEPTVTSQEVSLAKQLIEASTSKFDLSAYKDDYEAAVVKLVNAKRKGKPLPEPEPAARKRKSHQHHGRAPQKPRRTRAPSKEGEEHTAQESRLTDMQPPPLEKRRGLIRPVVR